VGEKVPHALALQETDHLTPALLLSFVTMAVRFVAVPATIDVGGTGLKATEMAGGVLLLLDPPPPPPQAVSQIVAAANTRRWIVLDSLIERLHRLRRAPCSNQTRYGNETS
jgi:hypothetical protein